MSTAKVPRRIMVIEDNIDALRTLVAILRAEGHDVQYAINGYAAIALAPKFCPQVVILDLGLPGLNGFEVCSRLRKQRGFQSTRFIALSGKCTEADRRRSRAAGCEAHLSKPADPNRILALVESSSGTDSNGPAANLFTAPPAWPE